MSLPPDATPPDKLPAPAVVEQLLALNRSFYAQVGSEFDATRQNIPPGMARVVHAAPAPQGELPLQVLDVGCGNGRLARALAELDCRLQYTGIDADAGLLALAETQATQGSARAITCRFLQADLATPGWTAAVAPGGYDLVACLATLHHLPGVQLRAATVAALSSCVRPGGRLVLSVWQFADSPRLLARMAPWSAIGLSATEVEPGDALLPWDGGTHALRYVHMLSAEDLLALAAPTGLTLREQWRADGRSGDQTLYLLLERAPQQARSLNTL